MLASPAVKMPEGAARTRMKPDHQEDLVTMQQDICRKYGMTPVAPESMVAVAISSIGQMPIYGTRIELPEGGNVSWFVHCGEHSSAADFYKPLHVEHLKERLPLVLKYLYLPPGSKFIIDNQGYEDVWQAGDE